MAYLPWSQLWMQKQLHTSEDLATSPSGFGYVTSTIPGKSLAHWGQIINIQTLNPVHSMNLGVALSCEPGVPWKIWFRWSPMDQRTFVEVQDSNREVAVPKKKKKSEIGCPGKSEKNKLTSYTSRPPHGDTTWSQEGLLSCDCSLRDGVVVIKGREGWVPSFLRCVEPCQRAHLCLPLSTGLWRSAQPGDGESWESSRQGSKLNMSKGFRS